MERIDKILSSQGLCSRREAAALVRAGAVTVDGAPVRSPADKADPASQVIAVHGRPLCYQAHVYILLHKPQGVLSASADRRERTVLDLLDESLRRRGGLFPAGRLDRDTEGLLLITDDGPFAHRMLSPASHVEKTYYLHTDRDIPPHAVEAMRAGVTIEGGYRTRPARLTLLAPREARLTITEGKYHQVKLMLRTVGCTVTYLRRERIGGVCLPPDLAPGEYRLLSPAEAAGFLQKNAESDDASAQL